MIHPLSMLPIYLWVEREAKPIPADAERKALHPGQAEYDNLFS